MFAGHLERAAIVAESVRRHWILGDVLNVIDVEPQQVTHGVLILITSKPAKDDSSAFALMDFVGVVDGSIEPVQNNFAFFSGKILFVIRRHFTEVDHPTDIMPGLGGSHVLDHVRGKGIETDFALLLLLAVTAKAFRLENRSHLILIAFRSRRRPRLGGQRATKHGEQK